MRAVALILALVAAAWCAKGTVKDSSSNIISELHPFFAAAAIDGDSSVPFMTLRSFIRGGVKSYLVVNCSYLSTFTAPESEVRLGDTGWDACRTKFASTPYVKAIREALSNDTALQDAGITHFKPRQGGIDLTLDLCPSKRPLA